MTIKSNYFYGNKVSEYGIENGYVDYGTLAKAFDNVLNNDIMQRTDGVVGCWEMLSGMINNSDEIEEQDEQKEVFQWYIVSGSGAELLQELDEIVYYNDTLDMYIWGVTHFGTSWDYVLTDIEIAK